MSKLHPLSHFLVIGLLPHLFLLACIPLFLYQLQVVLVDGFVLKVINAFIVAYVLYILTQKSLRVRHSSKNIIKVNENYSTEELEHGMQASDVLIDNLIEKSISMKIKQPLSYINKDTLLSIQNEKEYIELKKQLTSIPSWLDKERIKVAKKFYAENLTPVFSGLAIGLIESYTFPGDAKILEISGGLTEVKKSIARLSRTIRFVFDVINTGIPEYGSTEFDNIVNVRFIHGYVRRKCKTSSEWTLPHEPLNQIALAATLIFFCQTPLELLKMKGISISPEQCESCWQLWRYIGYLMGVDENLIPKTYNHGLNLRNHPSITKRQTPNEISILLTKTTLQALDDDIKIPYNERIFNATLYAYLGDEIHQQLDLPVPSYISNLQLRLINFFWCHVYFCDTWSSYVSNWKNHYFKKYLVGAKVIRSQ